MKRTIIPMALGGIVASLVFAGIVSHSGRPSLVPKVHADEGCSVGTLSGTYGFYRQGTRGVTTASASGNAVAAGGIFALDGAGNIVAPGHQTISRDGTILEDQGVGIGGTYQVNPDCTGQAFNPGSTTAFADIIVVDGGKGIYLMSLTPGLAVVGVARRVRPLEQ